MILSKGRPAAFTAPAPASAAPDHTAFEDARVIREEEWEALQRSNIQRALERTKWRVDGPGGAAELMGLRPTTLRSRMKAMGIKRPV